MSVAFDDHGEIVPGRGMTSRRCAAVGRVLEARPVVEQPLERVALAAGQRTRDFGEVPERGSETGDAWLGCAAESAVRSLARRNGESAVRPRSERMSAIERWRA